MLTNLIHQKASRWIFVLIALTAISVVRADPIYKSRDASGAPVFSDQGSQSAEEIELKPIQTYQSSETIEPQRKAEQVDESAFRYQTLLITSPADGEPVRDNTGNLQVAFLIEPGVQRGHVVELMLDDTSAGFVRGSGEMLLTNVDRGNHQLRLRVTLAKSGELLQEGPGSSVSLLRYSSRHN